MPCCDYCSICGCLWTESNCHTIYILLLCCHVSHKPVMSFRFPLYIQSVTTSCLLFHDITNVSPMLPFLETQHSSHCQHKLNPTYFPGFYLICINYFFRKSTGPKSYPISEILHYNLSIQTMSNQKP